MCRQEPRVQLSEEDKQRLLIYYKPVELYNTLRHRAIQKPYFLQRCLRYKIKAKEKKCIKMTVSFQETSDDGLLPIYIILANRVSSAVMERSAVYCFRRACMLTSCTGDESTSHSQASFILPEIRKLLVKSGSLSILVVSGASIPCSSGINLTKNNMNLASFPSNFTGSCLLGVIPMESLPHTLEPPEIVFESPVNLSSCFMKLNCTDDRNCVSFQFGYNNEVRFEQVRVKISCKEVGEGTAKYKLAPHVTRLRNGNVTFRYRYFDNKLVVSEVTEDFTCPFCLVKCASFEGLRRHLPASHDLFNFEFWNDAVQVVTVYVKTAMGRSEVFADGVDPKQEMFFYRSNVSRHPKGKGSIRNVTCVHTQVLDSNIPPASSDEDKGVPEYVEHDASSPNATGVSSAAAQSVYPGCVQSISGRSLATLNIQQTTRKRKLSVDRSDTRNRSLLLKRQFFHSRRAQPMAIEQVLSDRDSEDEADDEVAQMEDQRMLDDFVDVSKEEKQMMHLWNTFVRKQRVLADGHVPWACEGFTKLHIQKIVQEPAFLRCWRFFMIKLWNTGLLDPNTMNNCNLIIEHHQNQ